MIIFPAIDLRHGRCVRLYQGDPQQETVFSEDPVATALHWADQGAEWLHVVNLDGALGEESESPIAVRRIVSAMAERDIPVQFGGGLRTMEDIDAALDWGVTRVILGTIALREAELVQAAIDKHGAERIVVGIDAREGHVAVEGWQETSTVTALALAEQMKEAGIKRIVYTDITRDGTQRGANIAKTGELAQKSSLHVIASGGVGSLDHLLQVRWIEPYGVEGVIIGRALYEGKFTLREALDSLAEQAPE
ncbi:MAG: 1-(5-phosphoribosyl)-5-[(5-phosphoribosylamino)methylideneamino]imidazole-4-carboxamide isomerase [Chloroflexota bacterium]|nr:1-(5-phosphoribosyl)-5-[(5-phosphoribosylamino)methylideneamino]imidazole-4-carboxamide isomerase [Chloroflexota bacterium]